MLPLLLSLAILLVPPTFSHPADCDDAHVIGVRGSGQSGYGEQVDAAIAAIETTVESAGLTMSDQPLDYPAVSISDSLGLVLFTGEYGRSVETGVEELRTVVDEVAQNCPTTEIVLVGYSQGAHVIKTAFDGRPSHRISAVVLLADPTRDPAQPGVRRLGSEPGEASGAFGERALPNHLRPVAMDVCAADDIVCDRSRGGFVAHIDGYDVHNEEIARLVLALLDQRPERRQSPR